MSLKNNKAEIISLYESGIGCDTIGKKLGFHPNSILRFLKNNNVTIRGLRKKIFEEDEKEIVRLYKEGVSAPKIGEQFGIQHTMVLKYLEKNGVARRSAEDCHRKYAINEDFFNHIDTQEKAFVLGFLYADGGNILEHNFVRIQLAEKDKDILYKISALIYKENPDKHVKFYNRKRIQKDGSVKIFKEAYLNFNSKHICNKLNELGCTPKKSLVLKFPESITDVELQRHFIRGYYDGDGGVSLNYKKCGSGSLSFISTLEFNDKLCEIIDKELGLGFYERNAVPDKNVYSLHITGNRQIEKLLDWLYKDASIYLDRKYNLYLDLLAQIKETNRLINEGTRGYNKSILENNDKYNTNNE